MKQSDDSQSALLSSLSVGGKGVPATVAPVRVLARYLRVLPVGVCFQVLYRYRYGQYHTYDRLPLSAGLLLVVLTSYLLPASCFLHLLRYPTYGGYYLQTPPWNTPRSRAAPEPMRSPSPQGCN